MSTCRSCLKKHRLFFRINNVWPYHPYPLNSSMSSLKKHIYIYLYSGLFRSMGRSHGLRLPSRAFGGVHGAVGLYQSRPGQAPSWGPSEPHSRPFHAWRASLSLPCLMQLFAEASSLSFGTMSACIFLLQWRAERNGNIDQTAR